MTKLELTVDASTLNCVSFSGKTDKILGCDGMLEGSRRIHMSMLLANIQEFYSFEDCVKDVIQAQKAMTRRNGLCFSTCNLVFSAPYCDAWGHVCDRRPIDGVFASPMRAIHCCGELQMSCFTHVELSEDGKFLHIIGLEYARKHRRRMLEQEFGSWLLEKHIEKAVMATTMDGKVVFWNDYAATLYQFSHEEAMGKQIMELTPSDMTMEQGQEIMTSLSMGKHWRGMFMAQRKDKSEFMAHVSDTPILDAGGTVKFIVGVSDDYSQLHNVMYELERLNVNLEEEVRSRTQELLEREMNLRMVGAAIKASDTGVIITDSENRIAWTNDAVKKMLASEEQDLVGCLPWELSILQREGFESGKELANGIKEALTRSGDDSRAEMEIAALDVGTFLPPIEAMSVTVQRLKESDSGNDIITFRDVTSQRRAEDAQRDLEAAAAASEMKTDMMQMLSHELRTPLQGIIGVASTMVLDLKPEDDAINMFDGVSTILASARLLLTLISNMLDLRKVEADMMEVELNPVPIRECIADSVRFCNPVAVVNDVTLIEEDNSLGFFVTANRLRLEQCLVNLLSNGIKYTTPGTAVVVSFRRCWTSDALSEASHALRSDLSHLDSDDKENSISDPSGEVVVVTVCDNGAGISESEADKVFAAFVQLQVSQDKDRNYKGGKQATGGQSCGTGLGLNLVRKLLKRMNGHIWFENCSSGGAAFSFCLPLCDTMIDFPVAAETLTGHPAHLSPDDSLRFRILVVDDNLVNCKVLSRMLSRLGVKTLQTAHDGKEALDLLNNLMKRAECEHDPSILSNLVISDLQMPVMCGEELAVRIWELQMERRPVLAAWTADWTSGVDARCQQAGFDNILRKPITIDDLEEFLLSKLIADPKRFEPLDTRAYEEIKAGM